MYVSKIIYVLSKQHHLLRRDLLPGNSHDEKGCNLHLILDAKHRIEMHKLKKKDIGYFIFTELLVLSTEFTQQA